MPPAHLILRTDVHAVPQNPRSGLVVMGTRRSEVKEESRAQPGSGDMSEGGHPVALARSVFAGERYDRTSATGRNPPRTAFTEAVR